MRNFFRRPARIEAGATASINGRDMRITAITHSWENGFHTATVTFIDEHLTERLPDPIPYGQTEGETACCRCTVPISARDLRWSFERSVLSGPRLLDLRMNVPGADTVVVCDSCGPLLRGTFNCASLPTPGSNTITFAEDGRGQTDADR